METSQSNNDIRISNKINIYGNVFFIGSISVVSVGFCFFGIWITNFWGTAVILSAVMVYSIVGLAGLALLGLVGALWIQFIVKPIMEVRGMNARNFVFHSQENFVALQEPNGTLRYFPLFPPVDAVKELPEPTSDKATVLELWGLGLSLREIEKRTGVSYYYVQKWTSEQAKTA